MKRLTIGLLAHVDSGKTTLSEAMLYKTGEIRKPGRVDHRDSFLDTDVQERNRGITIFSKQAMMEWEDISVTLIDTPGHVDFSAEMERTLAILDYAVLLISGNDGIQSHADTLWRLLAEYQVPVFVFVNKMDLSIYKTSEWMDMLRRRFGDGCVDFSSRMDPESFYDALSLNSDFLTEILLEKASLSDREIAVAIRNREVVPCYFGSALKIEGVDALLDGIRRFTLEPEASEPFAARVFKISHSDDDMRLTFLKITGGSLSVKDMLHGIRQDGRVWEEKVNQIRIYSGMRYSLRDTAVQGMVCAVTGLTHTLPGDGLGAEPPAAENILTPFLTCRMDPPPGIDHYTAYQKLKILAEEDPKLNIQWNHDTDEIHIQLMGAIQLEVLHTMILERFGMDITFGQERITYKETIQNRVEGVGHFEPLRHYAEVHLILEPSERGSGLTFSTICSEDVLDRNWQRLILSHLEEKIPVGVLTGSPVTDVKITLAAGKAHKKHTEGGDFRQATYRAVRNGLRKAESLLLEPWLDFEIRLPSENLGRCMTDIQKISGRFDPPEQDADFAVLKGSAPATGLKDYATVLASYTRGRGTIRYSFGGYEVCHNPAEVIEEFRYDPDRDVLNTADSVFLTHEGSGIVPWNEVEAHMHLPSVLEEKNAGSTETSVLTPDLKSRASEFGKKMVQDADLMEIFEKTYGPIRRRDVVASRTIRAGAAGKTGEKSREAGHAGVRRADGKAVSEEGDDTRNGALRSGKRSGGNRHSEKSGAMADQDVYLMIDGYNVIHNWEDLSALAREDYGAARERLVDILRNYQGFTGYHVTVIFDAYKVAGGQGAAYNIPNIDVVYTKENETADTYIERMTLDLGKRHRVRVVSSDSLVQKMSFGHGALRTSAREFQSEVHQIEQAIRDAIEHADW